jgi:hypothetical protein
MRRGFAESKWRMATTPSSNASSRTVSILVGHAGRFFKTTECSTREASRAQVFPRVNFHEHEQRRALNGSARLMTHNSF